MKGATLLFIAGIFLLIAPFYITKIPGIICIICGICTVVSQRKKGDYKSEARRACEKVTPKRNKNITPPWEE